MCPVERPTYKRRTLDEAKAIALNRIADTARQHVTAQQFEYLITEACLSVSSGVGCGAWAERLGRELDPRMHFEVSISDWAESEALGTPPPKCWVRALVSRDRESEVCEVWWHPSAERPGT